MKYFFRLIRIILGPFLLLSEWLSSPKGIVRTIGEQVIVDAQCKKLALYEFKTCPFCIKVRQEMRRLSLTIEKRDAQNNQEHRATLLAQGGSSKVPCLHITKDNGDVIWVYESKEIIRYLQEQFS
jgi:glutaredoxin